eukprot:TRINITY_DN12003_c0_g1_i1.p1 TRINITY_DN12003_c0_g1~~TRINITY_DN12003_c0_g1_i1.p1  ORF type:complete len:222 (+),score=63.47 TRINITY_DN12003_c0_g1_i1:191-856(+)
MCIRDRVRGLHVPPDPVQLELLALRAERRKWQARRLAEEGLERGRASYPGAWRELELREPDPEFQRMGPDAGEEATMLRAVHLEEMRERREEHAQNRLRVAEHQTRIQNEVDGARVRKDAQRWLGGLKSEHWNGQSFAPPVLRKLEVDNVRQMMDVRCMETERKLRAGMRLTQHLDQATAQLNEHGFGVLQYKKSESEYDMALKQQLLVVAPLDPDMRAPF